jgi:hypothetical protein
VLVCALRMASAAYIIFSFVLMIQGGYNSPPHLCLDPSSPAGYNSPSMRVVTAVLDEGYPLPVVAACSQALAWQSFSTVVAKSSTEAEAMLKMTLADIPLSQVHSLLRNVLVQPAHLDRKRTPAAAAFSNARTL